jgi:hypothetical protein
LTGVSVPACCARAVNKGTNISSAIISQRWLTLASWYSGFIGIKRELWAVERAVSAQSYGKQ